MVQFVSGQETESQWGGLKSDGRPVWSMAISPDESMVVSGSADDLWERHDSSVTCLHWFPDAQEVASGSEDGTIRRWNPDTGRQIALLIEASHGWVCTLKYSPQGDRFANGREDKVICV
jgi:WD40 repeat protein